MKLQGSINWKFIFLIFPSIVLLSSCFDTEFQVQEGDLLFQKWESSDFAKAINAVTEGYNNNDFAHIGMVIRHNDTLKVFEATMANGVGLTPLDTFLNASLTLEGQPNIAVGRLRVEYKDAIPSINNWVLSQLNKPYDTLFIYGNEKYYCSELIHDAFNNYAEDVIFELAPMTFKDPGTMEFFPIWKKYYESHNAQIPEGQPGINPGLMSRSPKLDIVHEYW